MGMNQSTVGMWKNNSLINLHLLTGQIGKPGAGPFSLTGQPNAMGGRESGLLCHQLPGYRLVEKPNHRAEVERFWGLTPGIFKPSHGFVRRRDVPRSGERNAQGHLDRGDRTLSSVCPILHHVSRALTRAELVVVVRRLYPTET